MSEAATIMVVEDHTLLRKGLCPLIALEDDLDKIAEASNGADAGDKAAVWMVNQQQGVE